MAEKPGEVGNWLVTRPDVDGEPAEVPGLADLEQLRAQLGLLVREVFVHRGEPTLIAEREGLFALAEALRDQFGYQLLRSLTAVDRLPAVPRFEVVYHFLALPPEALAGCSRFERPVRAVRVKVPVSESDALVPSLVALYPAANWYEREVWDLFGIEFAGHPDLRRILLPPDYEGHPLRKDHPLQYEVVAFSHNHHQVMAAKPRGEG